MARRIQMAVVTRKSKFSFRSNQTNNYRRRDRVEESEKVDTEEEKEKEKRPRMSGSLIQNPHDDITTRIKNIEYIEIGRHRLRFSPLIQIFIVSSFLGPGTFRHTPPR